MMIATSAWCDITSNKKAKHRRNMAYSSTSLSADPIPHGEGLSVPNTPVVSLSEEESVSLNACNNEDIFQPNASKEPHVCNQQELDDLTRLTYHQIKCLNFNILLKKVKFLGPYPQDSNIPEKAVWLSLMR